MRNVSLGKWKWTEDVVMQINTSLMVIVRIILLSVQNLMSVPIDVLNVIQDTIILRNSGTVVKLVTYLRELVLLIVSRWPKLIMVILSTATNMMLFKRNVLSVKINMYLMGHTVSKWVHFTKTVNELIGVARNVINVKMGISWIIIFVVKMLVNTFLLQMEIVSV